MSLISDEDKTYLKGEFEKNLRNPVKIVVFKVDDKERCPYCAETVQIMEELSELSDKISVEVYDGDKDTEKVEEFKVDKFPATIIMADKDLGARYYGIPSGYEFSSVIEDIVEVSHGHVHLQEATLKKLELIDKPVHIQVFVTPSCPYCPRAVRTAHQFAFANEHITADMVEATEFPELSEKYGVMSVPKIVINDKVEFVGAYPEPNYIAEVLKAVKD